MPDNGLNVEATTVISSSYFQPSSALSVPSSLYTTQSASPASVLLPSGPFSWHHHHVTTGTTGGLSVCVVDTGKEFGSV